MRYQGRVVSWNEARGFGFVVRHGDTVQVFLHIGRLPLGAKRPVPGDVVTYALGRDERGRTVAVDVDYPASSRTAVPAAVRSPNPPRHRHLRGGGIAWLVLLVVGAAAWIGTRDTDAPSEPRAQHQDRAVETRAAPASFACEPGKTHCTHMRSLDEARFYLRHCPDVKLDGDNDGEPCEQQFAGRE